MKKYLSFVEKWFTLLSLTFFIGNPLELLIRGSVGMDYSETRNGLEASITSLMYAISFLFFISRWRKNLYRLIEKERLIWLVLLIALIALLSSLWSSVSEITLRRSSILVLSTLYGIYFGTRYTLKQQLAFLAWGFGLVILMSLFFGVALPQYGIENHGAWRGIYGGKNGLGGSMVLGATLFLVILLGEGKRQWIIWVNFTLSVILLLLSRSSTSLVAFLALILFLILYRAFRLRHNTMIPILIFTLLVVSGLIILIVAQKETVVGLMGKDLTLTGRTNIWPVAWDSIQKKPLLGYGYQGFWWPQNHEAMQIWRTIHWRPTHPHNGLLKILLEIGWLGTLVFLTSFFIAFIKSLFLVASTKSSEYYWPISFLTFMLLTNLTESDILVPGIAWILYVGICLSKAEMNYPAAS